MMPKKSLFEKYINENGISKKKLIVIYDQVGFFVQPEFGSYSNILDLKI